MNFNEALQRINDAPTPDAVASVLDGVTGDRETADKCPVARYLSDCLPWEAQALVRPDEPAHWSENPRTIAVFVTRYRDDTETRFGLSDAAQMFIRRFDRGAYPHLIDHN